MKIFNLTKLNFLLVNILLLIFLNNICFYLSTSNYKLKNIDNKHKTKITRKSKQCNNTENTNQFIRKRNINKCNNLVFEDLILSKLENKNENEKLSKLLAEIKVLFKDIKENKFKRKETKNILSKSKILTLIEKLKKFTEALLIIKPSLKKLLKIEIELQSLIICALIYIKQNNNYNYNKPIKLLNNKYKLNHDLVDFH